MAGLKKQSRLPLISLTVLLVAMTLVAASFAFLYWQERSDSNNLRAQVTDLEQQIPLTPEEEVARLVSEIGAVYELPSTETPVVATVEDITKFDNQPFFAKAQNGDKLLIFNDAKWAFLYRPSTQKIINSGPTAESSAPTADGTEEATPVEATAE